MIMFMIMIMNMITMIITIIIIIIIISIIIIIIIKVPVMNETFVLGLNTSAEADPKLLKQFTEASTVDEKMAIYYDITLQVFADMLGNYLQSSVTEVPACLRTLQEAIADLDTALTEYHQTTQWGADTLR